ncbi:hypothetical protein [Aeromonas phage AerS_266]|nr:hypothetical protein [Aeromonas phage AerS_266]
MKDSIKQLYYLNDLTDQFFCYVNEHDRQVMFSKYMLNLEGWRERFNLGYLPKLENCDLYFRRTESFGCPVFHITPFKTLESVFLGRGLSSIMPSLNGPLSKDFDIKPNSISAARKLNVESLALWLPQYKNTDKFIDFDENKETESTPEVEKPAKRFIIETLILIGMIVSVLLIWGYDKNLFLN